MDNEIAGLAMTGSDEPNHNPSASYKESGIKKTIRVWMANPNFYSVILANANPKDTSRICVVFNRVPNYDGDSCQDSCVMNVPFSQFIDLFADNKNYDPICFLKEVNLDEVFGICGNDPEYSEKWSSNFNLRSFSIGDIAEVIINNSSSFFVCCSSGWKLLSSENFSNHEVPNYNKNKEFLSYED